MSGTKRQSKKATKRREEIIEAFQKAASPIETNMHLMVDPVSGASFCECHIKASKLISLGTTDVPLDPEEQGEFRANREVLWDSAPFDKMVEDALKGRPFSNIVAEFNTDFNESHPIKIIGGQHRFEAIKKALANQVDSYHGMKIYVDLTPEQRLDAQLISNTNLAVSPDLLDRMEETQRGPQLRSWCHEVGLLPPGKDFTDKYERGGRLSVQMVRTFIVNYCLGKSVRDFEKTNTTPSLCPRGQGDDEFDTILAKDPTIWKDEKLAEAAREFVKLVEAQRQWFKNKKASRDRPEKALNIAILSAWAFVAGVLATNPQRLQKHFALKDSNGKDPLNADALDKGKHKTDGETYRGLGFRTDAKERGRFVELFYIQAEKGCGVTPAIVNAAIANYHAKDAMLEAVKMKEKVG